MAKVAKKKSVKKKKGAKKKSVRKKTKKTRKRKTSSPTQKTQMVQAPQPENVRVNQALLNNFVSLQKVMLNLSTNLDNLSAQMSKLLDLFEISAKSLAEKDFEYGGESNEKIMEKLENISEQAGLIGKGLSLIHEVNYGGQGRKHYPRPRPAPQMPPRMVPRMPMPLQGPPPPRPRFQMSSQGPQQPQGSQEKKQPQEQEQTRSLQNQEEPSTSTRELDQGMQGYERSIGSDEAESKNTGSQQR